MTHLEQRALSDAKCERMIADIKDGEDELHYSTAHRERLEELHEAQRSRPVGIPIRSKGNGCRRGEADSHWEGRATRPRA
jgi:hypothetical protein